MFCKLKTIVSFLRVIVTLLSLRPFGNIIHDIAGKYGKKVSISDLRKFEKTSIKVSKAELDLNFLKNCLSFNVFPKFICFQLPNTSRHDVHAIRKRLLRSAIAKRRKEFSKLTLVRDRLADHINGVVNNIDRYILHRSVKYNVGKAVKRVIATHEKKLKNLTRNMVLPFSPTETVTNLSSQNLTSEQLGILKYGLSHSICTPTINKTDVFSCFELIHRTMVRNLIDGKQKGKLVADLSHLAHSYVSSHQPSVADLRNFKILKELRKNKDIVILKPDKGNGVVVMDRIAYEQGIFTIISDTSKFKVIDNDPTLQREGKLQRFLRALKNKGHLDKDTYERIYPVGSQPARFYGLPKMHKARQPNETPPFRPIVSSIGTYNYNLSKFLCDLLEPHVPCDYNVRDTFSFVHEINQLPTSGKFMVSFDVESLFTSLPLDECIDLAVTYIYQGNPGLAISPADLKTLFSFATAGTHFLFKGAFHDQVDGVAMGSPLAPVLANLFMGHHEKNWLDNFSSSQVLFYRRYVDDTFCLYK
ncbi:uncharacterized protein [Montipora capricornis]|uniref:uncharacterized protein n=1 Tax=Montipora capricornis TaxID=246305 RepID=UPI0035F1A6AE